MEQKKKYCQALATDICHISILKKCSINNQTHTNTLKNSKLAVLNYNLTVKEFLKIYLKIQKYRRWHTNNQPEFVALSVSRNTTNKFQ